MFFLTGASASSALDLIARLQETLGGNNANNSSSTSSSAPGFDPNATATGNSSSSPSSPNGPTSLLAPSTLDALLSVQGQNQSPVVNGDAFSAQLFSLLDTNQDGSISKSEFETAFGQNGNTTQADAIFSQLDANGDGSVSAQALTNALDGQDQAQGQGTQGTQGAHHHHHHHQGGFDMAGGANASSGAGATGGDSGGTADPLAQIGGSSQTVTNTDGSTTTTITYADGSQVSMTIPAAGSSGQNGGTGTGTGTGNGTGLNNFIERMIERQAQMLAQSSSGQALSISA